MEQIFDFTRARVLNTIPALKLQTALNNVDKLGLEPQQAAVHKIAINRYAESNIPIDYWTLRMDKEFRGDPILKQRYEEYVFDLNISYVVGKSICFAGNYGIGKTLTTTCILKKAAAKGFTCLYTTLSDVVSVLTQASNEDKFLARRELMMVSFLAIDEVDSRYVSSDSAADLFGRSLEGIFRTRSQNKLPTLMCSNTPNVVESFNGSLKASIGSLMSGYMEMCVVFGNDHRKGNK